VTRVISCNDAGAGRDKTKSRFTSCLIIADGFYEFTDPDDKKKKRKDKWLFTKKGESWFCIAGIWRANPDVGEDFTMLNGARADRIHELTVQKMLLGSDRHEAVARIASGGGAGAAGRSWPWGLIPWALTAAPASPSLVS
jgi:SOS response associated peptidase (SRAP)